MSGSHEAANDADPRFDAPLQRLALRNGLHDLDAALATREYEEWPLYTSIAKLDFLRSLPLASQNRLIIRTVAGLLESLVERLSSVQHASPRLFVMMTIQDWWDVSRDGWASVDGRNGLLTPSLWIGNRESDRVAQMHAPTDPTTAGSAFVRDCLGGDPRFSIKEGLSGPSGGEYLDRVYVWLSALTPPWQL